MSNAMHDRLVRLPAVRERTALSKTTIYALMKDGRFPACVRVGLRAVAWRESQLAEWMESRERAGSLEQTTQ